jgi:hypothetical protein
VGIAAALNMHKPNARRDALKLVEKGLVEARENGQGYAFFSVGGALGDHGGNRHDEFRQRLLRRAEPAIIEGEFKIVPPEVSAATDQAYFPYNARASLG